MAYIISGFESISGLENITHLNCMKSFIKKTRQKPIQECIYNNDIIQQQLKQAAEVKQQLERDIFERDRKIQKCSEYAQQL